MKPWRPFFILPLLALYLAAGCSQPAPQGPVVSNTPPAPGNGAPPIAMPPSRSESDLAQFLHNQQITTGDGLDVTKDDVCKPGYSKKVSNVTKAIKDEAYRNYGI